MTTAPDLWVRADAATEVVGDSVWTAPLPHGPLVRLEGVAIVLLEQFREPVAVAAAVDACGELIDDAPVDALTQLRSLADDYISTGLLAPVRTTSPTTLSPTKD